MKKMTLMLFVAFLSVATVSAQFKLGVRAGFNASTITNTPEGTGISNYFLPGFQVGLMAQYLITPQFGIESGLYYSTLGIKSEVEAIKTTTTSNPSYLQVPITALYKFDAGLGLYLYPQAGVYVGYGLGGKIKAKGEIGGMTGTGDVDYFSDKTNRFDMGLTLGFNVQHSNLVIGLGYDLGLLKINKESVTDKDLKNGNIKVTVGYFFF